MNNYIYTPTDKQITEEIRKFYCKLGDEDFVDTDNQPQQSQENEKTVAKYYHVENIKQYAIKLSTNNELFNPYSIYDTEKSHSPLHNTIRNSNRFIFVNQTVFEYYLKFLMTKNNVWLKKAERERL